MQLNIDGFNLNYNDVGDGTPVLMLHGWGSSCDAYNFMTKTFSDRFRMVSLDFPGFGKSDMINEPWDVEKYCQITLKFIEKLGITDYIIVGHSFGGRVIIKLAGTDRINPKKSFLLTVRVFYQNARLNQRLDSRRLRRLRLFFSYRLFVIIPKTL